VLNELVRPLEFGCWRPDPGMEAKRLETLNASCPSDATVPVSGDLLAALCSCAGSLVRLYELADRSNCGWI